MSFLFTKQLGRLCQIFLGSDFLKPTPAPWVGAALASRPSYLSFWLALGSALCWAFPAQAQTEPQLSLPRVQIAAGIRLINPQVASTPEQREVGLMFRTHMARDEGMLFVFERPSIQCFWMKNTPLALTAAFIADDGRIVNLADMQPLSTQSHCSQKPVRFVLEMNQGWFARAGLREESQLRSPLFGTP